MIELSQVKTFREPYEEAKLSWYKVKRGDHHVGDLLAAFELFQLAPSDATDEEREYEFPTPQCMAESLFDHSYCEGLDEDRRKIYREQHKKNFIPMPHSICPKMSWHRMEIMFWGLRDLKTGFMTTVKRPYVEIECSGGEKMRSDPIMDVKANPSFDFKSKMFIQNMDVMLPDHHDYCPPLSIKVYEQKTFGKHSIFGSHTVTSVGCFRVDLDKELTKKELEAYLS